jgi:AAA family ATP:ADP antiporter
MEIQAQSSGKLTMDCPDCCLPIGFLVCLFLTLLSVQFPSPNEYSSFMGDFSTATGIATFTMMLLSQYIFDKYGWGVAAKITPTVLLLTGIGFFSLILFGGPLAPGLASIGITPLLAAVYVGALQNIFSKSAKYSLFDPCKEMAYIPLDEETKV